MWVHLWRELHEAERRRVGKDPHPSAAIMDSQSVKTVEESARIRGFDAHKCIKGRKRHLLVDTLALVVKALVHHADLQDRASAPRLLLTVADTLPRLELIWADSAYVGPLQAWVWETLCWRLSAATKLPVASRRARDTWLSPRRIGSCRHGARAGSPFAKGSALGSSGSSTATATSTADSV